MKPRSLFRLFALSTAILLAGCAVSPLQPPTEELAHPARDAIRDFAVDGRFALKITLPDGQVDSSGGRLSWTHVQQTDRVLLANPLGMGLAEIERSPEKTQLRTGDGKAYAGDDADLLIAEITGQPLPISHLPAWLRGRLKDAGQIECDALGRPIQLQEAGWHISYRYDDVQPGSLPTHLTALGELRSPGATTPPSTVVQKIELRLRIENWKALP